MEAAKSYFSIRNYEKAKDLFLKINNFVEAGECIIKMLKSGQKKENVRELYIEALDYFDKANQFSKAIECCEAVRDFTRMFKLLKKYGTSIGNFLEIFETNMKKYIEELATTMMRLSKEIEF